MPDSQCICIVFYGASCSGKTTIARELAKTLGWKYVSIGDIIRKEMQRGGLPADATAAYDGRDDFPVPWLTELAARAIPRNVNLVVDANPPFVDALTAIRINVDAIVLIEADDAVRFARFNKRSSQQLSRMDDTEQLFLRRSRRFYQYILMHGLGAMHAGRLLKIDGEEDLWVNLRRCLLLATALPAFRSRGFQVIPAKAPLEMAMSCLTPSDRQLIYSHPESIHPWPNETSLVFLIKPGVASDRKLASLIQERLNAAGARIISVIRWQPCADRSHVVHSHLGMHYVAYIGGSAILPPAFRIESRTQNILSTPGYIDLGIGRSQKLEPYVWISDASSGIAVNAHIPKVLGILDAPDQPCFACHIAMEPVDERWRALRTDVLGASNPATAIKGSLRSLFMSGVIPATSTPDWANNGFHLSANPIEASRELAGWFGTDYSARYSIGGRSIINSGGVAAIVDNVWEFQEPRTIWLSEHFDCHFQIAK